MTTLKDINFGFNEYCGPAVMSALTGKSTDECASVIMAITGKNQVKAVETSVLIKAFSRLHFDMIEVSKNGYTLFANLSYLSAQPGRYVVMVPKHFVAVEVTEDKHLFLVDNHSRTPLPAEGSARLSQRCEAVYKITERAQPVFLRTEIKIDQNSTTIFITAKDIYDTETTARSLGRLSFRNESELNMIIDALILRKEE